MTVTSDHQIRVAVFDWLDRVVSERGDVLDWDTLLAGAEVGRSRVPLISQRGIWRPRILDYPLSIVTSPNNPYGDTFSSARQLRYHYFKDDPQHADNVGLRRALQDAVPLVYLWGVSKGRYVVVWPSFVRGEHPAERVFLVEADDPAIAREKFHVFHGDWRSTIGDDVEDDARRIYTTREVRQRLHQRAFRERVLAAYRTQCAVCHLRHERLLDAAHIVPDQDPEGLPIVRNGLSLCKLHHSAFDNNVFGIRRDLVIEVRDDILREHDGPMLKHGIQGINGQVIYVPRAEDKRPDPERLERRYEQFKRAG